jgi:8-oxo-dGTP diphosphatase
MNKSFIDKLALLETNDGKLLFSMSRGLDTWYIPGGKREEGESDEAALAREVKEELSVDLLPSTVTFYGIFEAQAHNKPPGTIVRMTCYTAQYTGKIQPSSEIEHIAYFSYHDTFKRGPVDDVILDDLYARGLIK